MIQFSCRACGKQFNVADTAAGRSAKCPCGATLQVPGSAGHPVARAPVAPQVPAPVSIPATHQPADDLMEAELISDDSFGMWQDLKLLVIQCDGHSFPPRCVKTNEPHAGPLNTMEFKWVPNQMIWTLAGGLVGLLVASATFGKSVMVQVPISPEWQASQKRHNRIGWSLVGGGIGGLILGVILGIVVGNSTLGSVIVGMGLLGPVVSLGGLVYLAICSKPPLKACKITDQFAWIEGVSPQFLADLPAWPGPHAGAGMD